MIVRPDQMKVFAQASWKRFDENAAAYLRAHYGKNTVTQDAAVLSAFIDQGVRRAAVFGISREVDVIRFLEVLLVTGTDFENSARYRWVADYLREDMRAEARLDLVIQRLHFDVARTR